MRKITTLFLFLTIIAFLFKAGPVRAQGETFAMRVLTDSLNFPWEITYGPNDSLFVTEARGYKVYLISVFSGVKKELLNISGLKNFTELTPGRWPQGGLMGLALHPNLYSSDPAVRSAKPWIYLAYVYNKVAENFFVTRIVRYDYVNDSLENPVVINDSIPGSSDHNSGRMVIGPDLKLYYTVGDMGAGKSPNTSRTNHAQVLDNYEGKSLRINLEPDGDTGLDAWVPNDNPHYDGYPISAEDFVYSMGHRNAQGLVWGNIGGINRLYSCEHGDKSDDEINILTGGKNYGWPAVAGYCDGNYDTYTGFPSFTNEAAFCADPMDDTQEPIASYTPLSGTDLNALGTNSATFPTIAPSSIDIYQSASIPGWKNSLLVTTLKRNTLFRLKLNSSGDHIAIDTIKYFAGSGRLRDICLSPDGLKIYVASDDKGKGGKGRIVEYSYGVLLALNDDSLQIIPKQVFKVYPNPSEKIFTVQSMRNVVKPLRYQLISMTGRLSITGVSNKDKFDIDAGRLTAGIYLFKLFNGYGVPVATEKLVVR